MNTKYYRDVEYLESLDNTLKDLKIVCVSDIHISSITKVNDLADLLKHVMDLNPDYICMPGDLIDSVNEIEDEKVLNLVKAFLYKMGNIAPTMVGIGNHDMCYDVNGKWVDGYNKDFFNELDKIDNVHILDNKKYEDDNVIFSGYTQPFDVYYNSKMEDVDLMIEDMEKHPEIFDVKSSEKPSVLLVHSPLNLDNEEVSKKLESFNYVMSGHMHEGLMFPGLDEIISGNKGILSPSKVPLTDNARGYKMLNDDNNSTKLIINGGVTKLSKAAGKLFYTFNFVYPSEINIINIEKRKEKEKVLRKVPRVKYGR